MCSRPSPSLALPFSGPAGKNGINGKDGRPGPSGPAGPRGEAGAPGAAGKNGKDGAPGQNGSPGPRGIQGVAGPAGPQVRNPSLYATFFLIPFRLLLLPCPPPLLPPPSTSTRLVSLSSRLPHPLFFFQKLSIWSPFPRPKPFKRPKLTPSTPNLAKNRDLRAGRVSLERPGLGARGVRRAHQECLALPAPQEDRESPVCQVHRERLGPLARMARQGGLGWTGGGVRRGGLARRGLQALLAFLGRAEGRGSQGRAGSRGMGRSRRDLPRGGGGAGLVGRRGGGAR
jgi:hypothetical protein